MRSSRRPPAREMCLTAAWPSDPRSFLPPSLRCETGYLRARNRVPLLSSVSGLISHFGRSQGRCRCRSTRGTLLQKTEELVEHTGERDGRTGFELDGFGERGIERGGEAERGEVHVVQPFDL